MLPIAVQAHHALVDGMHVARLLEPLADHCRQLQQIGQVLEGYELHAACLTSRLSTRSAVGRWRKWSSGSSFEGTSTRRGIVSCLLEERVIVAMDLIDGADWKCAGSAEPLCQDKDSSPPPPLSAQPSHRRFLAQTALGGM